MSGLAVRTHVAGGVAVLVLEGELDISSAPRMTSALATLWESGAGTIVVDLRGLTFMDSTGLRILVQNDARAREEGVRFVLVPAGERVQRLFEITDLQTRLEFVDAPPAS